MEKITLNMTPSACLTTCHASQYDIGRQVRFDLVNGADAFVLSGAETVTLKIRRADGVLVENAVPNTSSNYVIWTSVAGECDAAGVSECELRVTDGADVLGSANFLMSVEADAYDGQTQIKSASGAIATFETGLADALVSAVVNVVATGGYDADTQTAHPINGYTEANITRCGVNLFDKTDIADGYIDDTTGAVSGGAYYKHTDYMPVVGGQKIYIMTEQTTARWGAWYDKDKNYISGITNYSQTEATAPNNACFIRLTCKTTDTGNLDTFAVNYPSTPTYIPYNGQTYTVNFGQTVYGCVLGVTRGKLTVNKLLLDMGDVEWYYPASDEYFYADIADILPNPTWGATSDILSDTFETTNPNAIANKQGNNTIAIWPTGHRIVVRDTAYTDKITFRTAMTGKYVVYPLATTFDIDLTPEVISAIVGTNNVFADCGDIAVEYLDLL